MITPDVEMEYDRKSDDPMVNFRKYLKKNDNKTTENQYPGRLKYFFDAIWMPRKKDDEYDYEDFVTLEDKIEDQAKQFVTDYKEKGTEWVKAVFFKMLKVHKKRVEKGEITEGTIFNYYKSGRRFCDANGIKVDDWTSISRSMPTGRKASDDRVPTEEEIKKLIGYSSDIRIKPIIYTMLSAGIRLSSWGKMKWKHIEPHYDENGKVDCAKLTAFNIKRKGSSDKWYYTFITPEAYDALMEYRRFRELQGEKVDGESWVMVQKDDPTKQLLPIGIKTIIERAAQRAKIFDGLKKNHRHREWKITHSWRKYFKTKASEVMDHLIVEMCLDHDTGLAESYYKAKEPTRRANYLKAVPLLTIEDANKSIDKITAEVTRNVTADFNQQLRNVNNRLILIAFKSEMERFVSGSIDLAKEEVEKTGGSIKRFEWSHKQQIEWFLDRMKKMDETVSEDQINYIKQYLQTSKPTMIYKKMNKEEEKRVQKEKEYNKYLYEEDLAEQKRLSKMTKEEIENEDKEISELQARLNKNAI